MHALRLDDAVVVHHTGQQAVARPGAQQHHAAIGLDQAAVACLGVELVAIDHQAEQPVAVEVERDVVATAQGHRAQARGDPALIEHLMPQQRDLSTCTTRGRATTVGNDAGTVFHGHALFAVAKEAALVAAQTVVIDVQRAGHQATDVHLRARAKQNAVGVDQIHPAVGIEPAEDLARVVADHPVERNGAGRGLFELHRFVRGDAKAAPVDRHPVAGLGDGGDLAVLPDAGLPRYHLAILRRGPGRVDGGRCKPKNRARHQ